MPRFRKKPIEIEAFQMTRERRWDNSEWPEWLNRAWNMEPTEAGCVFCVDQDGMIGPGERLCITTLEGTLSIAFDDWIIKGAQGELYPCKPEIFDATYEYVAADNQPQDRPKDSITLKWGSLKAWELHSPKAFALLKQWAALGSSLSAMMHRDTPEQKELICQIIDAANCDTIYLDWEGKEVSKEEAKQYVMNYGKQD